MSISIVYSNTGVDVPRLKLGNIIMFFRHIFRHLDIIIGFDAVANVIGQEQYLILFKVTE